MFLHPHSKGFCFYTWRENIQKKHCLQVPDLNTLHYWDSSPSVHLSDFCWVIVLFKNVYKPFLIPVDFFLMIENAPIKRTHLSNEV